MMLSSDHSEVQKIVEVIPELQRKIAPETVKSYEGRLKALGCAPESYVAELREASTRQDKQFRKSKAAMIWDLACRLGRLSERWLKLKGQGQGDLRREVGRKIMDVHGWFKALGTITRATKEEIPRSKKTSKRQSLAGTPDDVDERVAAHLRSNARPSGLVLMVSGCRPLELERGVLVELDSAGMLQVSIQGAKVTEKAGHPWRVLTASPKRSKIAAELHQLVTKAGGRLIVKRKRRRLHRDIQGAAKTAGFSGLSPYSFRHLIAARLKKAVVGSKSLSPDQQKILIAKMLGHSATKTQGTYGSFIQGKGALALVSVRAAREVRITHRPAPNTPGGPKAVSKKLLARLQRASQLIAPTAALSGPRLEP
jgi:integrase